MVLGCTVTSRATAKAVALHAALETLANAARSGTGRDHSDIYQYHHTGQGRGEIIVTAINIITMPGQGRGEIIATSINIITMLPSQAWREQSDL